MGESVLSRPFERVDGGLLCGRVPASELADRFGTPLYVYDMVRIEERVRAFADAFSVVDHTLAYSVKANGNLSILRALRGLGCGADITSGGELFRAVRAGIDPAKIYFAGVGKTVDEIRHGLDAGIRAFHVESRSELERIESIAREMGVRAPFGVRVNPDVFASTPHEYTRTGHYETKFGVPWEETRALYRWAATREHLAPVGIDVHIGSQIVEVEPYAQAVDRVLDLVSALREDGVDLEYLDIGGGYGISYDGAPAMDLAALAVAIGPRVSGAGLHLVMEPGRSLVGDAGLMLTRVQYIKRSGSKTFVIVDCGMSELIRPSHYGGYHTIERVDTRTATSTGAVDIVGPICETGDFLARDRTIEIPEEGELLAVHTVGAYGFAMSSNYNGRRRPAEALVHGSDVRLIRERESFEDLIRGEE